MCLPIIGAVISGIGSAMSAMTAAAQAKAQAEMQKRQALIERESGAYSAARKTDEVSRLLGSGRAATAANGLAFDGSAGEILDESATEGAMDVAGIRWNSRLQSDNLMYQAKISNMNAKSNMLAAPLNFLSPVIEGVAKYRSSYS